MRRRDRRLTRPIHKDRDTIPTMKRTSYTLDRITRAITHPLISISSSTAKRRHRKIHPECAVCGVTSSFFSRNNDVHHIQPEHLAPEIANDPLNLITLCRLHHWTVGHFRNWKDYNPSIQEHALLLFTLDRVLEELRLSPSQMVTFFHSLTACARACGDEVPSTGGERTET